MILPDDQVLVLLAQAGIDQKTLSGVQAFSKNSRASLQEAVIEKNVLTDEAVGMFVANTLKVPFVSLSKLTIPEEIFRIVPERMARKYSIIAFARDADGIKLAVTDPTKKELQEMIAKKTGQNVTTYLATERDIENVLQNYRKVLKETFDELIKAELSANTAVADDAPIAKITDLLIITAYRDKASDIHIEPEEGNCLIRFRIDGILRDVLNINKKLHDRIITRIKVLSRLRTDEHMGAQDGKMRMDVDNETLDLRVSIIPIADGEKVVLRLLTSKYRQFSLQDLGMNDEDLKKVNSAMNKSYGMILSTGPTGSGKTTTIYALIKILNTREKNITTIEDPVEYRIKGVNQIQVNVKSNLTFANGLRSILRQDPNVIFVGEIRDSETAGIGVNAALTGHLVVSTLHTNDAATALPRLIDMKVEPFLVASTVNVIIGQRLVRKICDSCKLSTTMKRDEVLKNVSKDILEKHFGTEGDVSVYRGVGCSACHDTGYRGRVGIFEVINMSENIKKRIIDKNDSDVIAKEAIAEGMTTMLDDGLDKVARGFTTIEEVLRVTKVESL